jgi:tetratricopeptide (TPR) repeat protein
MKRIFCFLRRSCFHLVVAFAIGLAPGCSKKANVARHLSRANRYYGEKRFEEAALEYENVLQVEPNHSMALERLGGMYYERGQTPQALGLLLKARQAGVQSEPATLQLARLCLLKGRIDDARKLAISLLDKMPGNEQAILLLTDAIRDDEQRNDTTWRLQEFEQRNGEKVVHVGFGKLALRQGDLETAEAELLRAEAIDPNSSAMHVALATLRWRQGDLKAADQHFQRAADLTPGEWSTCLLRADFKLLSDAPAEARKVVQEVQLRSPQSVPAWLVLARIAIAEKNYDESLELIKKVQHAGGSDAEVLLLQSQVNLAKGATHQAVIDLEQLCEQFPRLPQFQYHLAVAYLRTGQLAQAVLRANLAAKLDPRFEDAILLSSELAIRNKEFAEAVSTLSAFMKTAPRAERAYPLLAGAYRGLEELDRALATCQQWSEAFPNSPHAPYFIGLIRRRQGKTGDARAAFAEAVALEPTFVQPLVQLVDLDLGEKNYAAALRRAEQSASDDPKSVVAQILLAQVHLVQGATDQAEAALLKALDLDPGCGAAGMLLAQLYVQSNRSDQAREKLTGVVAKNPNDWHSLILLGLLQQKSGDFSGARTAYEKVIQLNPKHASAYNNLAYICAEQFNDLEAASRHAQKARELAPEDASIADTLGWVLYRRREYARALPLLLEAAEHQLSNPEVQFHLGATQYLMGQEGPAGSTLQRALKLAREFPGKSIAERRVWILNLNPPTAAAGDVAKLQSYATGPEHRTVLCSGDSG